MFKPAIIVHGGAWAIPPTLTTRSLDGVKAAARKGQEVMARGGSAVDAVEAAVSVLEDDTAFDAGESLHGFSRSEETVSFKLTTRKISSSLVWWEIVERAKCGCYMEMTKSLQTYGCAHATYLLALQVRYNVPK